MTKNYLDRLEQIQAIAQTGAHYSKNPFDLERFQKILQLITDEYAEFTGFPNEAIKERFNRELGYVTPKIGVNGALFNKDGQILLEHRSDDFLWGIPGGWVDVGEGPETAIKREFLEEANLVIEPVAIIKFYTRTPGLYNQPHTSVHVLYYCEYVSGDIKLSKESLSLEFKDPAKITEWHKDHQLLANEALQYFDDLNAMPF